MSDITMTEKTKEEIQQEKLQIFFSSMKGILNAQLRDFQKEQTKNSLFKAYDKDDIVSYLKNPAKNEKILRDISKFLYNTSSHYKRLINHFANMHLLRYKLTPIKLDTKKVKNKDKFKMDYLDTATYIDNMNISHEFRKILNVCFREDVFFGYEYETDTSYFIKQINSDYCQISSIEDGVYNYSFDFSYFDKFYYKLDMFPKEFKTKYNKYKKDSANKRWQELDSQKTICIKLNEDLDYSLPPFIGVFDEVYNIQDYKDLKKTKKELENYQLLNMEIPLKEDNVDEFLLSLDKAYEFYNLAAQVLPSNVGLMLSPMEVKPMKFDQDKVNSDAVVEAEDLFWSSAGVNGNLFNSKGNSGSVVSLATKSDEAIVFAFTKQLSRWVNRKLKFRSKKYSYKFEFLDITINNEKDYIDNLLKQAQYGEPVKMELVQARGMTVSDMDVMTWIENDIFDISNTWLPLNSSFVQSGDSGRDKKKDEDISDSGEQSREIDAHKSDKLVSE